METAPCPHCRTPNGTNLVACYYCGRRLDAQAGIIPDDLPDYRSTTRNEMPVGSPKLRATFVLLGVVFAVCGCVTAFYFLGDFIRAMFVGSFSSGVPVVGVFGIFLLLFCWPLYPLLLALLGYFLWLGFATYGPKIWLKFTKWWDELRTHCHKVRAGQI